MFKFGLLGAGDNMGMELYLAPEENEYVSYVRDVYGVQVAIHPQEDFPDFRKPIYIQPGYDFKIFITPSVLNIDKTVCSSI